MLGDISEQVAAAVVGGVISAVVTAVLTQARIRRQRRSGLPLIPSDRAEAIAGRWRGKGDQPDGPDGQPLHLEVVMDLQADDRQVKGSGTVTFRGANWTTEGLFEVRGHFMLERFLQMEYRNRDKSAVQFGAATLELNARGDRLNGVLAGYGARTERPVTASLSFEKE